MSESTQRQGGGDEATPGERGRTPDAEHSPVELPAAEMVPTKAKVGSFAVHGECVDVEVVRVDRSIKLVVSGTFSGAFFDVDLYEEHALIHEQVAALRSLLSDE